MRSNIINISVLQASSMATNDESAVTRTLFITEMLEKILHFAPPRTVLTVQRVCRHFHAVITTSPILQWRFTFCPPAYQSSRIDLNPLLFAAASKGLHEPVKIFSPTYGNPEVRISFTINASIIQQSHFCRQQELGTPPGLSYSLVTPFSAGGTINHGAVLFSTFGEIIDCMEKIRVGRGLRKLEFRFTKGTRVWLDGKEIAMDQ